LTHNLLSRTLAVAVTTLAFHSLHYSPMLGTPTRPLEAIVDATGAAGFAGIGLDRPLVEDYEARVGPVATLTARLYDAGLVCTDVLPFFAERGDASASARAVAELAGALAAPVVVGSVPAELPWNEIVDRFGTLTQHLADVGARVAIEYIPHSGLRTMGDALRLCSELAWNGIALAVDSYHSFLGGATVDEIAALSAEQIAVVQFSDARSTEPCDRPDESRNHRQQPGQGVLPLADFVGAVRSTGYDGVVAAEVLSQRLRDSHDLAADVALCHASLARYWQSPTDADIA
jgi:sugar phosphate isomerase/epimerase